MGLRRSQTYIVAFHGCAVEDDAMSIKICLNTTGPCVVLPIHRVDYIECYFLFLLLGRYSLLRHLLNTAAN